MIDKFNILKNNFYVCNKCLTCKYYIDNNDTEAVCVGDSTPCFEYIKDRYLGQNLAKDDENAEL